MSHRSTRPETLTDGPMSIAPENELGVVFLFAHLAKRWRLRIETIRAGFPDCIAYQKTQGREKRLRIEFEYRSRNFKAHRHSARACDWIVCWEHNWPDVPHSIKVVELRREFGLGFNVWIQPTGEPYKYYLEDFKRGDWSVASQAHKGDLVLMYQNSPERLIEDVFVLTEDARYERADWKAGKDHSATIRRVATLDSPIFWEDLKNHRIIGQANFVRGCMRYRPNATEYWPYLFDLMVRRNKGLKRTLARFDPAKLAQ